MSAELLSTISLISYIVAGIALVAAIFVWFYFKIPSVIGDLSGRTAKKSIEKMRQSNDRTGVKSYRASAVNMERGKLTETMQQNKQVKQPAKPQPVVNDRPQTGLLKENVSDAVLSQATEALDSTATTSLLNDTEGTVALDVENVSVRRPGGKTLTMIDEVMLIHTNEVI